VKHVEVFRMGGVGTSIIGRPRPLPGHRPRATRRYTLNCEGLVGSPLSRSPDRYRFGILQFRPIGVRRRELGRFLTRSDDVPITFALRSPPY
jgi:hypothetical protein